MKTFYTIPLMISILAIMAFQTTTFPDAGIVKGKITSNTGDELIGVSIQVEDGTIGTTTDFDGVYSLRLKAGKYKLLFTYIGYETQIKEVEISSGKTIILDLQLQEGGALLDDVVLPVWTAPIEKEKKIVLFDAVEEEGIEEEPEPMIIDEVVVTGYAVPLVKKDMTTTGSVVKSKSLRRMPTRDVSSMAVTTAAAPPSDEGATIAIKGGRGTHYYIDGVRVESDIEIISTKDLTHKKVKIKNSYFAAESFLLDGKVVSKNLIPLAALSPLEVIALEKNTIEKPKKKKRPKAGQLTASEWRDLDHWKDWQKEQKENREFIQAKKDWQLHLNNRYKVLIENKDGQPLSDVVVELKKGKETLWTTRTDNFGKAELWTNLFDGKEQEGKLKIVAKYNGKQYTIKKVKSAKKTNQLKIDTECYISNQVDIMFAVDATGSMGDEINYLKSELQDVIQRVQQSDDILDIRLGSVFYRDHNDAYLTQVSPLDRNIQTTIDFIQKQRAGGGGDFPEAVDAALEVAIGQQNWSDDAAARIVFLVLDAPPHMGRKNITSLQKSIRQAAEQGIKIIPITASGINKSTEYLMKAMALATNGTYVYITDDSGIGNSHLKPSNKKSKVEFLNDLMVRLIGEYTDRSTCEEEEEIDPNLRQFVDDPNQNNSSSTVVFQNDPTLLNKVKYFPNPATEFITIQLQETISEITIIHSNGQVVKRLENVSAGSIEVDLDGLSEGFYLIRFKKDRSVASGKLIVIQP